MVCAPLKSDGTVDDVEAPPLHPIPPFQRPIVNTAAPAAPSWSFNTTAVTPSNSSMF